jgi:hypothetical protein
MYIGFKSGGRSVIVACTDFRVAIDSSILVSIAAVFGRTSVDVGPAGSDGGGAKEKGRVVDGPVPKGERRVVDGPADMDPVDPVPKGERRVVVDGLTDKGPVGPVPKGKSRVCPPYCLSLRRILRRDDLRDCFI